jgi:hypothetical protein
MLVDEAVQTIGRYLLYDDLWDCAGSRAVGRISVAG